MRQQKQILRVNTYRRSSCRRLCGKGKDKQIDYYGLTVSDLFYICGENEANKNFIINDKRILCSIKLLIYGASINTFIKIYRCKTSSYSIASLLGKNKIIFGYLLPGDYIISIIDGDKTNYFCVRVSPSSNIVIKYNLCNNKYCWWLDSFKYSFNK